ncbi:MAG: HD domain-containing protein [Vicingaceae bacterium]|nr:MAG: HD domain-containing protein [Vicingaceae bacterium]
MDFKNLELHILSFLKENLSDKLLYHNLQHSIDVAYFTEFIGKKENCTSLEITLLKTAPCFTIPDLLNSIFITKNTP